MAPRPDLRQRWAVDRQQLIILIVATVMVASFTLLVLWPKRREMFDLGEAVERERDLVSQKLLASQRGVYVSARIPSVRRAQGLITRRLPYEPEAAPFLQTVAECVAQEPLVTHEMQQTEARAEGPAPAIGIRLKLTGPFDAVYRCMAAIEGLERLARFRRVHLAKSGDGGHVVAEADFLVYYLPDEEPKPAASARGAETDAKAVRG